MAKTNQIDATVTAEQMTNIKSAIQTIQTNLPFLVEIGTEEIRRMAKAGDLTEAFLQKALAIAEQSPEILPRNFAIEEFRSDMALASSLDEITLGLRQLLERIENPIFVARSDACCCVAASPRLLTLAHRVARGGSAAKMGRPRRGILFISIDAASSAR